MLLLAVSCQVHAGLRWPVLNQGDVDSTNKLARAQQTCSCELQPTLGDAGSQQEHQPWLGLHNDLRELAGAQSAGNTIAFTVYSIGYLAMLKNWVWAITT